MTPARKRQPPRRSSPPPRKARGALKKAQPVRRRAASQLGGDQVEGRQAVRELLNARRRRVYDVWVSDAVEESPFLQEIADLAREAKVPVREVSRGRLDAEARTEAPQGVLAHAEPLKETDLERMAVRRRGKDVPFLVGLDGVTDPQNLGALLRTADSAGVTGIVLPRHRAAHVTPSAAKAAAGAIEWLPFALVPGMPSALSTLSRAGVWTVGLAAEAETSLFDLDLADQPVAIILGAEGAGLSRLTRERCDVLVRIPQRGHLASLNVAAAGALACFEVARRRLTSPSEPDTD